MARRSFKRSSWSGLGFDALLLGMEASCVIGLRMAKLAEGPGASAEFNRMIGEKIETGLALQLMALTGGLGTTPASAARKSLAHYKRKVSANRRRLTKGR